MEDDTSTSHHALQAELIEAFRAWKPSQLAGAATKMLAAFTGKEPSTWAIKDIQKGFKDVFTDKSLPNCTLHMYPSDLGGYTVAILSQWDAAAKLTGFTLKFAPKHTAPEESHQRWKHMGFSVEPVFVPAREIHGRGSGKKKKAGGSSTGKKPTKKK